MSEKIKYDDLFEEDIFLKAKQSLDLLLRSMDEFQAKIKNIAKDLNAQSVQFVQKQDIIGLNEVKQKLIELVEINKKLYEQKNKAYRVSIELEQKEQKIKEQGQKLQKQEEKILSDINKLKEKYSITTTEQFKEVIKLRNEISKQNKTIKEQIKQQELLNEAKELGIDITENEIGAYKRVSDKLNTLRKLYKDLVAAGRGEEQATKDLLEQIRQLDAELKELDASVGQFQRQVGSYNLSLKEHFTELNNNLLNLSDSLGEIGGVFQNLTQTFKLSLSEIRDGFKDAEGGANKFKATLRGVGKTGLIIVITLLAQILKYFGTATGGARVLNVELKAIADTLAQIARTLVPALISATKALYGIGKLLSKTFLEPYLLISKTLYNIATLDFSKAKNEISEYFKSFVEGQKELSNNFSELLENLKQLGSNDIKTIYEAHYKSNLEFYKLERKRLSAEMQVADLRRRAAELEIEYNKIIEDDYYRVFERLDKMEKLQKTILETTKNEFEIRRKQLEQEIQYLQEKLQADKTNLELIDKVKEKQIELINLSEEQASAEAQIQSELRQIYKDRRDFVRELTTEQRKYLIEIEKLKAEAQNIPIKTLLAETKAEIDAIVLEFDQLIKLSGGSYFEGVFIQLRDEIVKLKQQIADQKIRQFLMETRKNFIDLSNALKGDDLDLQIELINIQFEAHNKQLQEIISTYRELGQEVPEDIIKLQAELETLQKKQIAETEFEYRLKKEQELFNKKQKQIEQSKKLQEIEFETQKLLLSISDKELEDIDKRIIEQNKLIELKKKDNELLLEKIKLLNKEIELEKEKGKFADTERTKELTAELEILGAQYNKNQIELEKFNETQKELLAERNFYFYKKLAREIGKYTELVSTYINKLFNEQNKLITSNIQSINNRINTLEKLAETNKQNASESIKELEQERQKLEQEQKELEKRRQRAELLMASLDTYSKYIQSGQQPLQALASTIKDITLLKKFVDNLPVYHTGTEYVEASRREVLAVLERGERVVPKELNKKLGNISNKELVQRIEKSDKQVITFEYNNLKNAINTIAKRSSKMKRIRL